jgi:hypothetical protein
VNKDQRRALVVRGGWEGHSPVEATDRFVPFLKASGFTVDISSTLDSYLDDDLLAGTDLIVQCWTMGEISEDQRAGLDRAGGVRAPRAGARRAARHAPIPLTRGEGRRVCEAYWCLCIREVTIDSNSGTD